MAAESNEVELLTEASKDLSLKDMFKLLKAFSNVLEKKALATDKIATKHLESKPAKGTKPAQLTKNVEWCKWVKNHALKNGWPAFIRKEKGPHLEILMAESEERDGAHVYSDSPANAPKQITLKEAMSLGVQYKNDQPALYREFEAEFLKMAPKSDDDDDKEIEAPKPARRLTAAELAKERADAAKAKKAAADAAKSAKGAKVPAKAVKKSGGIVKADEVELAVGGEPKPKAEPAKKISLADALKAKAAKPQAEEVWDVEDDGNVYPWTHPVTKKKYHRTAKNLCWEQDDAGEIGDWVGVWDPKTKSFDTSVPAPRFE
jgi:antitoxin component of MazEF toxin-antitoxin module